VAVLALAVLAAINVRAQSAADFAQTAAYAAAQQNADGGFAAGPGQPSTLGATNTGLRVLDYVGGSLLDEPGCIRFVTSCKVPGGGFAQRPGGKPDVVTTSLGLMAAAELKIADKAMIDDAIACFRANTRAFEEVRMSIAGLEAVGARSPDFSRWAEQLEAMRTPDGLFGQLRSLRVPGTEMSGYQADLGENFWGCLYDESRRNKVLVKASSEALSTLKKNDWNHYVLCAVGDRITLYLNGVASVVYREEVPNIARDGLIAVQIHAGSPMEVQFKDIQIRVLP
jgi:hypothetical protein